MEAQESPDVQNHIRSLVYDYAKEHITSDYDKYTIEHANQLLSNGLKTISSLGPTDLTPLVDPMQALLRQWNLSSNGTLAYGEEKLTVPPQTMAYLRRMLAPQNQPVRRDPFVYDEKIYSHAAQRPYHTIISRRAQNATPNIGKGTDRAGVPRTFVDLVEHHCIKAVHIDPVVEPPIDQEKILSLRSPIDIPTQAGIKVLFESLPSTINQRNKAIGKLASRYVNSNSTLDSFLRCPSPTPTCPRPMTPPIFTRTSYRSDVTQAPTGKTLGPTDFADFMEIVRRTDKMLQPIKANDNKIFDIAKENLIIVNGWNAFPGLSSPTMSPPKSQDSETRDQLDEDVWKTSPPLEDFSVKKLEPVIFPRSKQMGYPLGVSAVDTPKQKQTLHEFMWPHLHHLAQRLPLKPGIVEAKAEPTDVSPSILGQASSTAHMEDGDSDPMIMDLDDVDGTIEYIYRTVKGEDPAAIIMRERIDQVDALLLDVPFLPAPNVHPTVFNAPTKLKDLLAPPQHLPQKRGPLLPVELDDRLRPEKNRFALKKVIGVQSLNIELPWRPFIIGESTIPTLESITNIEGDIVAVEDQKAVEILLGKAVLKIAQQEDPSRKWFIGDLIYQHNPPRLRSPEPLMLSRAALRSARQVEQKDCPGIDAMISTNELQVESRRCRELLESRRNLNSALATTPLQLPSGVQTKNRSSTPLYRAQDSQEAEIATGAEEARRRIVDIQCPKSTPSSGLSQGNPLQEGPTLSYSSESKAPQRTQLQLAPSCATAHNQNRLKEFIGIRSKDIVHDKSSVPPSSPTVPPQADPPTLPIPPIATIPLELLSHVAYLLDAGNVGILPGTIHRYIASYDLLQKRGIVRNLMSREVCSAELIERENVVDVDLIIDAGAAVIFFALPALPVTANALIERLSTLSWRYSKILVVFESYPPSHSRLLEHGTAEPEFVPYAFGPPVLKSFKHLRRSLCISESTGSKNGACGIEFVFALGEVEAARYVRLFADHRIFECADDANKALSGQWDGREWLVEDIYEGEEDLAAFDGMNLFSAIAIVSTVNLTSVIEEMTPKERIELFSGTVGYDRMINFNRILHERSLAIASSPTPYVSSRHTSDGAKAFVPEFD